MASSQISKNINKYWGITADKKIFGVCLTQLFISAFFGSGCLAIWHMYYVTIYISEKTYHYHLALMTLDGSPPTPSIPYILHSQSFGSNSATTQLLFRRLIHTSILQSFNLHSPQLFFIGGTFWRNPDLKHEKPKTIYFTSIINSFLICIRLLIKKERPIFFVFLY